MCIEIKQLSVIYKDGFHSIQALEEVSLAITSGKCLAIVGESGSGKTTLGKACMGLLPSNAIKEGEININDRRIDNLREAALNQIRWNKIAMVFQNGAVNLNPVHRIIDQVAEPLIQRRLSGRREANLKAKEALEQMGVAGEHLYRYPHQLSGGQTQRILLAMAIILDPEIIILDEPTSSLDALSKVFISGVIDQFKSNGKAVLLITHDLEMAAGLADTVTVLYLGQILETLPANDLLFKPLHPYTLGLGRSYPTMTTTRDLGGIRGDAFYRHVHQHGRHDQDKYKHTHIQIPDSSHKDGHAPPDGCIFQSRCTQAIDRCQNERVDLKEIGKHTVRCLRNGIADILNLKGVTKSYGDVIALQPTDLTLKCGEVFCLVGETGSGKTTLAMISAGMLKQDSGERSFEGRNIDQRAWQEYRSMARRIGLIYQNPAESISPRFSVFEAVAEPLKIHKTTMTRKNIENRVSSVLAQVHLSTDPLFLKRFPHELNMGAIQRVCMARALILEPSLLVADEPTSSLDPSVQAKVLKLLLDLQTEMGLSMLFITHNIAVARKIADRIAVMLAGRLVEVGPAGMVLSAPRHPYTRMLIDSVSGSVKIPVRAEPAISFGCPFLPRCPRSKDVCREKPPEMSHVDLCRVRCHFPLTSNRLYEN
ncbi:MAG: ABC transporter ATP-binding protein [Desulfobacterales bacterium]|nr:ABC transporter ATP-binding protein [Desulfobacterales bacterium]MDX2510222.1 ABC transporter ATP-binding protein [Desulfobacterales bacterium]